MLKYILLIQIVSIMKKFLFYFLFLSISLLIMSGCDDKNILDEKEGVEYYKQKQYEKALPLLEKSASSGNSIASYYLGEMFYKGEGVEKNENTGCQRYLESSKGGNKNAYLVTAICFYTGRGWKRMMPKHSNGRKS